MRENNGKPKPRKDTVLEMLRDEIRDTNSINHEYRNAVIDAINTLMGHTDKGAGCSLST